MRRPGLTTRIVVATRWPAWVTLRVEAHARVIMIPANVTLTLRLFKFIVKVTLDRVRLTFELSDRCD